MKVNCSSLALSPVSCSEKADISLGAVGVEWPVIYITTFLCVLAALLLVLQYFCSLAGPRPWAGSWPFHSKTIGGQRVSVFSNMVHIRCGVQNDPGLCGC